METRAKEIEAQAEKFHADHPRVWELFDFFTRQAIDRGFKHYSATAVCERIRWETDEADVDGTSTFKVNNNYRTYYARWWMEENPQHAGFFRRRELVSAKHLAVDMEPLGPDDYPSL